jgi:hypothetical protein
VEIRVFVSDLRRAGKRHEVPLFRLYFHDFAVSHHHEFGTFLLLELNEFFVGLFETKQDFFLQFYLFFNGSHSSILA